MNKKSGFALLGLLPLILLVGVVAISIYLLAQKTGFLNHASELSGSIDYAVSFSENSASSSGTNYVSFPPNASGSGSLVLNFPFTIEGWFKTPKPSSGNYLHVYSPLALQAWPSIVNYGYLYRFTFETQDADGSTRPMFAVMKNNPQPFDHNNYISVGANSSVSLPANTWGHVAVTASSSGNFCYAQLYVNGKMVDSRTMYTQNCQTWKDSPTELTLVKPITGEGGISGFYYPGQMNEIRISNTIRYTSDFTPLRTPLNSDQNTVALWHFDQSLLDSSPNSNNGTAHGVVGYVDSQMVPPTAYYIGNFTAVMKTSKRVLATWKTANEINVLGFNVRRATKRTDGTFGKFVRVNQNLIPAKNLGKLEGGAYRLNDDTVAPVNTYQYKLEVIGPSNEILETSSIVKVKVTK